MNTKLYVGNLSFDTTENDLQDLFAACGPVSEVNLVMDRSTNRPRGFAFVTMATPEGTRPPSLRSTAKTSRAVISPSTKPVPVKSVRRRRRRFPRRLRRRRRRARPVGLRDNPARANFSRWPLRGNARAESIGFRPFSCPAGTSTTIVPLRPGAAHHGRPASNSSLISARLLSPSASPWPISLWLRLRVWPSTPDWRADISSWRALSCPSPSL